MSLEAIKSRAITINTATYISPKTKASDRFLEFISDNHLKKVESTLKFVDLDTKDEYDKDLHLEILDHAHEDKDDTAITHKDLEKVNSFEFNVKTKSDANNFVNQVKNNLSINEKLEFSDVIKNTKYIDDNFIDPKSIKLMSLKKAVTNNLNSIKAPTSIKNLLEKIIESLFNSDNSIFDKKPEEIISIAVNRVSTNLLDELTKQADLAFDLIDFTFNNGELGDLEVAFFEKLRKIITDLDKGLREIQKQVEAKKKDSKVEIKIKRFDIKDLEKYINKKTLNEKVTL